MIQKIFRSSVNKLSTLFRKNELAYLGLTSKPELHLRDKLAFNLQEKLNGKYLVSREWQRYDLAILLLNSVHPIALCELKIYYTFDIGVPNKLTRVKSAIQKDAKKLKKFLKCPHRYLILFLIHPEKIISEKYHEVIAYYRGLYSVYRRNGTQKIKKQAKVELKLFFKKSGFKIITKGEYDAGQYYGIKTSILYWLVKV